MTRVLRQRSKVIKACEKQRQTYFFFLLRLYDTRLRLYNTYNTLTSMNI